MVDKRAFLVIGPESSGTKFLTSLFLQAGCQGDKGHEQRWDRQVPTVSPVVWRRSYPHGGEWPDLGAMMAQLDGYEVRVIVIIRSLQFTVESRKRRAVGDVQGRAIEALQMIMGQWQASDLPGVWITYEALVGKPKVTLAWLFGWCGLPTPAAVNIFDGNKRYG